MHAPGQVGEQQCSCQVPCLTTPLRAVGCEGLGPPACIIITAPTAEQPLLLQMAP